MGSEEHEKNLAWLNAFLYAAAYVAACMMASTILFIPLITRPSPWFQPDQTVPVTYKAKALKATSTPSSEAQNRSNGSHDHAGNPPAKDRPLTRWPPFLGILLLILSVYVGGLLAAQRSRHPRRIGIVFIILVIPSLYFALVAASIIVFLTHAGGFSGGK
ncbi:MAG: hypothetical protein WKF77_23895 [Planctomycetaceae bacterium]